MLFAFQTCVFITQNIMYTKLCKLMQNNALAEFSCSETWGSVNISHFIPF